MSEQSQVDSATDNPVTQETVERKIYNNPSDAVGDLKNLLGLDPNASRNQETESDVSKSEEVTSEKNNDELGEDAELIDLLDEEVPIEKTEDFINIDGEQVPLEDLKKQRLMQKDYTQKTQKLSEEKKEIDSIKNNLTKEYQEAKQKRDLYEANLNDVINFLNSTQTQEAELDKLLQTNPNEYIRAKAESDKKKEALVEAQKEQARVYQEKKSEQDRIYDQYISSERTKLENALPIYADVNKGPAFRTELVEFAKSQGFTTEEIGMLVDHRSVLLLANAMKYQRLRDSKIKSKKVNAVPKTMSSTNQVEDIAEGSKRMKSKMDRLKKSGSVKDATSVLEDLLNNNKL